MARHISVIFDDSAQMPSGLAGGVRLTSYGDLSVGGVTVWDRFKSNLAHPDISIRRVQTVQDAHALIKREIYDDSVRAFVILPSSKVITNGAEMVQLLLRADQFDGPIFDGDADQGILIFPGDFRSLLTALSEENWKGVRAYAKQTATQLDTGAPVIDISQPRNFLQFISGSTKSRAFNDIKFDAHVFTKASRDKAKIKAEHDYYYLIPEEMQGWFVQPYNYREEGDTALYQTRRMWISDAAFQLINDAWSAQDYQILIDFSMKFLSIRGRRDCSKNESLQIADQLFREKVEERRRRLDEEPEGQKLLALLLNSGNGLDLLGQFERYLRMYARYRARFALRYVCIGHGDPCLSNILFDPRTRTFLYIDPRGAASEASLFTHPYYDYCKLSHSLLGEYDYINNSLFRVTIDSCLDLRVDKFKAAPPQLKSIFVEAVEKVMDVEAMRIGEVSLFLSMIPLHLDRLDKCVAFLEKAKSIMDEIENGNPS